MAASLLAPDPPAVAPWRMPRRWADQQLLLERQHARLEALLAELVAQHAAAELPSGLQGAAEIGACRRLLWDLRLHLRLEERWLARWGVLCPGHQANHRAVAQAALADLQRARANRCERLRVLQGLQGWFLQHQAGPDATAYALAARAAAPGPAAV